MKQKIKNTLKFLLKNKIVMQVFKGKGIIFMLHRISPFEDKLKANENMKVSKEFLERFIKEAKEANYTFISMDELYDGIKNNNLINNFICITIDDGYRDNLEYGYEVFLKHNVPFCIYISTSLIESTHNMWWFGLEDYLLENTKFKLNGEVFDISSKKSKEEIFLKIRNIIIEKSAYGGDILDSLNIKFDSKKYAKLMLSWEDIKFLDNEGGGGSYAL